MAVEELKKTLVLGHRNPDTDSICSAICYAGFKHQLTGENYEPCRAKCKPGDTVCVGLF